MSQELTQALRSAMFAQRLSLRKLSEACSLSASTVSRILSGKQPVSIGHLQAFSRQLDIPLVRLMELSGMNVEEDFTQDSAVFLKVIHTVLAHYGISREDVVPDIRKELQKYRHYARTQAGQTLIKSSFAEKLESVHAEGVIAQQLQQLFSLFLAEDTVEKVRDIAGSVLLYLILTPDVIPDYAFPIGYLDDAIAVILSAEQLKNEYEIIIG